MGKYFFGQAGYPPPTPSGIARKDTNTHGGTLLCLLFFLMVAAKKQLVHADCVLRLALQFGSDSII
jgi:hypothetical protein